MSPEGLGEAELPVTCAAQRGGGPGTLSSPACPLLAGLMPRPSSQAGGLLPKDQAAAADFLSECLVVTPARGPPSCGEAVAPNPFPGSFAGGARGTDLFSLPASISQAEQPGWKEAGAVGSLSKNVTRGSKEPPVLYTRARGREESRQDSTAAP